MLIRWWGDFCLSYLLSFWRSGDWQRFSASVQVNFAPSGARKGCFEVDLNLDMREEQINGSWSRGGSWFFSSWDSYEEKGVKGDALPLGKQALAVVILDNDAQKLLGEKCLVLKDWNNGVLQKFSGLNFSIWIYRHKYLFPLKAWPFGMSATLPENWQLWQWMSNKIVFYFTSINILQNILKVDLQHVVIYHDQGACLMQDCWRLCLQVFWTLGCLQ